MLTVEAHRLSHTNDVFHLVISVAKTIPLLLDSCKKRIEVNKSGHDYSNLYFRWYEKSLDLFMQILIYDVQPFKNPHS